MVVPRRVLDGLGEVLLVEGESVPDVALDDFESVVAARRGGPDGLQGPANVYDVVLPGHGARVHIHAGEMVRRRGPHRVDIALLVARDVAREDVDGPRAVERGAADGGGGQLVDVAEVHARGRFERRALRAVCAAGGDAAAGTKKAQKDHGLHCMAVIACAARNAAARCAVSL